MKAIGVVVGIGFWLLTNRIMAQPGLKGAYYNGTNFEHKVLTRVDRQLHFRWVEQSPATGVHQSYYSVRWTGQLLAPASGRYTFYAKVDDGIRIWVGNQKVMDAWHLNDSRNFTGSIVLKAGQSYDLRVDYFNDMLGGVIELYWQRPDVPGLPGSTPGTLVSAQYFQQTAPPVVVVPKSEPLKVTPVASPKTTDKPFAKLPRPKPAVSSPPAPKPTVLNRRIVDTVAGPVAASPSPKPVDGPAVGETFVLRHVQFEQSNYILLPESSTELDKLVDTLLKNSQWRIEVSGYTDNVGDPRLNRSLSENRAKVVAHYLVRHGIAETRIETNGYGSAHPVADNTIEDGRAKNRRVEITIR